MLDVPGICDRCGQRYLLRELRQIFIMGSPTNMLVCDSCWEPSHPQLDTRNVRTDDKQSVDNSRSDDGQEGRGLYAWRPWVGCDATSTIDCSVGKVRITTV